MAPSGTNKPYAEADHSGGESVPAKAVNHREHPDIEEKKENLRSLHRDENHSDAAIANRSTSGRKGGSGASGNYGSTHSSLQASHGAGGQGTHPHDTDRADELIGQKPSGPRAQPTLAEKLVNSPDDVGNKGSARGNDSNGSNGNNGSSGSDDNNNSSSIFSSISSSISSSLSSGGNDSGSNSNDEASNGAKGFALGSGLLRNPGGDQVSKRVSRGNCQA